MSGVMAWSSASAIEIRRSQRQFNAQRTFSKTIGQRLAVEILHHQERDAVLLADVIQGTDVRMIELRNRSGFTIKTVTEVGISRQSVWQDLIATVRSSRESRALFALYDFLTIPRL